MARSQLGFERQFTIFEITSIIPIITGLIVGIILLVIEHKTSWFKKHFSTKPVEIPESNTIDILDDVKEDTLNLIGASVTPINQLENPIGDWLQIAKEVKILLSDLYCSEVFDHAKYIPSVEFIGIEQIKNSPEKDLVFDITTNFGFGTGYVRVHPSGRIISCKFEAN